MPRISASTKQALQEAAQRASDASDAEGLALFRDLASPQNVLALVATLDLALKLIDRSLLPCLVCQELCPKGKRIVRGDGVWCSMHCAETDGEEWAQK